MKNRSLVTVITAAGLALSSYTVAAGGFGGQWGHSGGSLVNGSQERVKPANSLGNSSSKSGFGGQWAHSGGSLANRGMQTDEVTAVPASSRMQKSGKSSGFGGGWAHRGGTIYRHN